MTASPREPTSSEGRVSATRLRYGVLGFACARSEVSGQRLWGLFAERFRTPDCFFCDHLVLNYCPLAFLEASGRNRTPDKLASAEKARRAGLTVVMDRCILKEHRARFG